MKNSNKNFDNTTEENFLKNKEKRKKQVNANINSKKNTSFLKILKVFGIVLASVSAFFTAAATGLVIYYFSLDKNTDSNRQFAAISENDEIGNRATSGDNGKNNITSGNDGYYKYNTFLATATDYSGGLTDVIMVARLHYSETEPSVSVLQIPRDTYVRMSSTLHFDNDGNLSFKNFDPKSSATYPTKINAVYYHGKKLAEDHITALLKDAAGKSKSEIEKLCTSKKYKFLNADPEKVKRYVDASSNSEKNKISNELSKDFGITYLSTLIYYYFGIPIDYQAQVNLSGFRGIVDAIGGVDLEVPRNMDYDDPYQDLHIHLKKGYQHLDGKKAEQFVRFRSYARGDVDRLDAQKIFINAFLDKLLSPSTVSKVDDIIVEVEKNLYTSISLNDMLRFSKCVLKMNPETDVKLITLPGVGDYIGEASYFIPYRDESITLINSDFNVYEKDISKSSFNMIDYNDVISKEKPAIGPSTIDKPVSSESENSESDEDTSTENTMEDESDDKHLTEDEDNNESENKKDITEGDSEEITGDDKNTESDESEDSEETETPDAEITDIEIPTVDEEVPEDDDDENSDSPSNIPILDSANDEEAEEVTETTDDEPMAE